MSNVRGILVVLFVGLRSVLPLDALPGSRGVRGAAREAFCATSPPAPCESVTLDLKTRLDRLFAKQQRSGDIAFEAGDSLFFHHPVMATLALDAFRPTRDLPFLQRAHGALKGYFNYLLVYHDADKDFLVERNSNANAGAPGDTEDAGFNALLALDMLSLSRICEELDMPFDALFWYRGMRVVSKNLVAQCYDPVTGYFYSGRAAGASVRNDVYGLAAASTYFASELGGEVPLMAIRRYLLSNERTFPEEPAHYLSWDFSPGELEATTHAARMIRSLVLLGALEWNGLSEDAVRLAGEMGTKVEAGRYVTGADAANDEVSRYLACKLASKAPYAPYPRFQEIAVLDLLVFGKSLLDPERTASLRRSLASIERFVSGATKAQDSPPAAPRGGAAVESIENDIRSVYFSISLLRDKWKAHTLFSSTDRSGQPGFDVDAATSELLNYVVETLKLAENRLVEKRWRAEGFGLTASLEETNVGPGEPVRIRFAVSAAAKPEAIRSVVVHRQQAIDTLMSAGSPVTLNPGDPAREFQYVYPAPKGKEATLVPIDFSAEVRFGDARREKIHFRRAVYVTKPVTCAVRFPEGTTLAGGSVPVEVLVTKHLPLGATIQVQWYSPAGLKPAEGRSIEAWMPERVTDASVILNVVVPNPCRPGSFPFTLKIFANGEEVGLISSKLFKHYQWLTVGPFPGKPDALEYRYPPEIRANLFDTYPGALGQLAWQTLPVSSYADDGKLALGGLVPEGSVGFLYTVLETASPRASKVLFESDDPAVLYVNGEPVCHSTGRRASSSRQRASVSLKTGVNNVLIKTHSSGNSTVFFQLGDEEDLMSDEFNNNLWELVDGYQELVDRDRNRRAETEQVQRRVTITYRDTGATSVSVVGSFNGWSAANSTMRKNKYGEWEISVFLAPGRYTYRFLVNGSVEIVDPASAYTEPDGYGGQNSVLYVQ
jgi:hypothetical protein